MRCPDSTHFQPVFYVVAVVLAPNLVLLFIFWFCYEDVLIAADRLLQFTACLDVITQRS